LRTGVERGDAGVLVLVLTLDVTRGGAGGRTNERGDVGAAVIEGVGVGIDGVVVTAVAGVEGAGSVGNDDAGVGNAAVVVAAVGDVGVVGVGVDRTGIVRGIAFAVAVALAFGVDVGVDGASVAGDAGGVDVGIAVAVAGGVCVAGASVAGGVGGVDVAGVCDVGVVGVERAGGGGRAGGVVGAEGVYGVDDAAAAVCAVAVETRGWPGVHEVRGAGSSDVKVEGVLLVFERKALRLVGAFRVAMKNGRKVVGWAR